MMLEKFSFWFGIICALTISYSAYATLPENNTVPGGIAVITLDGTNAVKPKVFLNGNQVMVIPYHEKWTAIAGIPLTTEPGTIYLTVEKQHHSAEQIPLQITEKYYTKQSINLPESKKPPSKELLERLAREQKIIDAALKKWSNTNNVETNFIWPVHGRISTEFGLNRDFNNKYFTRHRGLDIAAAKNTPIKVAANGRVINIGKYLIMGNAVIVDHGQGLLTVYCHLNKILVKNGQKVKQGQIIGKVGRTGRATGPHLHWGVRLNNTAVDPMLFLS